MRELIYRVTVYSLASKPTSQCTFRTEREARKRLGQAITSAECASVGRILLERFDPSALGFHNWYNLEEWNRPVPEPDVQTAGYIVHSARTVNGRSQSTGEYGKTFHETEYDATLAARKLADTWKLGHEGLIVFKAIAHVQKVERKSTTTRIRVRSV